MGIFFESFRKIRNVNQFNRKLRIFREELNQIGRKSVPGNNFLSFLKLNFGKFLKTMFYSPLEIQEMQIVLFRRQTSTTDCGCMVVTFLTVYGTCSNRFICIFVSPQIELTSRTSSHQVQSYYKQWQTNSIVKFQGSKIGTIWHANWKSQLTFDKHLVE